MSSAAPNLPEPRDEDLPFSPSPTLDWIRAHFDELQQYRGKHVAIDPARGIVAVGSTDRAVCDQLDDAGIPPESDVVIHWVPDA